MSGRESGDTEMAALLRALRYQLFALVVSVKSKDCDRCMITAVKYSWALLLAHERVREVASEEERTAWSTHVEEIHRAAGPWLEVARQLSPQGAEMHAALPRLAVMAERRDYRISADSLSLADLDLDGLHLERIHLRKSHMVTVSARRAIFDDGDLTSSLFRRCDLQGARFVNAQLDRVRFEHCDLRNAMLGAKDTLGASGAYFDHCDLRGSSWVGRALGGATFADCLLHDTKGDASAIEDTVFLRSDLSKHGERTKIATYCDVATMWRTADHT